MFHRILFISAGLIVFSAAAIWYCHIRLRGEDSYAYAKLVQESADLRATSALEQSPIRQLRQGVRKDVWIIKDEERRHASIESAYSDLFLTQEKRIVDAVENLQKIEGRFSEGIGPCRHLAADLGTLHFPHSCFQAHGLCAEDAASSLLRSSHAEYAKDALILSGSFEIEHPLGRLTGQKGILNHPPLDGNAPKQGSRLVLEDGVFFKMNQSPFSISSRRLEATLPSSAPVSSLQTIQFFDDVVIRSETDATCAFGDSALASKESLILLPASPSSCCRLIHGADKVEGQEMRFLMEAKELFCQLPRGKLGDQGILFSSETGRVIFGEQLQPATILLEGNVRLISQIDGKESFALADSAIFHTMEKKLLLESAPSKRVLFWQEGLELSAPAIHIQDVVQGIGDVRLIFDPEEKNLVNRFHKQGL